MIKVKENVLSVKPGAKFGTRTVIGFPFRAAPEWRVVCECDCGQIDICFAYPLHYGRTGKCEACGRQERSEVWKKEKTTHGGTYDRLYVIWCHIKQRCLNPNDKSWDDYGGRGITICQEWQDNYVAFRDWAMANGYADDLEIDRYPNNDGGYEPTNCRWATRQQQSKNRRRRRWKKRPQGSGRQR